MARFIYIARDKEGKKQTGVEEGFSQEDVIAKLQQRNLLVVSVMPDTKGAGFPQQQEKVEQQKKMRFKHGGVNNDDLVVFCRQLATLLGAGVTILKSLNIIAAQAASAKLYQVIKKIEKDMEAGLSLHEAMSKHPKVFSELWVNLVESGEASGNLALVLGRLAGYLERSEAFKSKLISAMIYPALLFFAGLGALLFLTLKIIPTFSEIFKSFNIELPKLTLILMAVSTFLRTKFLLLVVIIVVIVFAFKAFIKTKEGRRIYENILFKLPVLGEFIKALTVERFSSEMSTLVESGVPILYSLEIAEHSVGNLTMADIIRNIKDEVRGGKSLSQPMAKSNFFEPMVVQMIAIGEEIGELPQMFKKINDFYQDYVETFLTRIASMFEPIMLIFMGGVIGIMVVGMFLPIFQLTKAGG